MKGRIVSPEGLTSVHGAMQTVVGKDGKVTHVDHAARERELEAIEDAHMIEEFRHRLEYNAGMVRTSEETSPSLFAPSRLDWAGNFSAWCCLQLAQWA